MNRVFLIGKIITTIDFKFIINSKNVSIVRFEIETIDKQKIRIKAYNEMADYIYSKFNKNFWVHVEGFLKENQIIIEYIDKIF